MKRKAMLRAMLICALGGMLFMATGVRADTPFVPVNSNPGIFQNPYWTPQAFLQTDWWTSLSAYHPLFWVFYGWTVNAPPGTDSSHGPFMGSRSLPRLCGGEEGFNIYIRR
jgi:hypothetical protein